MHFEAYPNVESAEAFFLVLIRTTNAPTVHYIGPLSVRLQLQALLFVIVD